MNSKSHPGEINYPLTEIHSDTKKIKSVNLATRTIKAGWHGKKLTNQGVNKFKKAVTANGAKDSGLSALIYPVMLNYAIDSALVIALANTLFFAAAETESKIKVALYLLINIAPFSIISPIIGPILDKIQRGRRAMLALSFILRIILCSLLIHFSSFNLQTKITDYPPWLLYPLALTLMILSKSFSVLKAAITPRVLPAEMDLVKTNAKLTLFGLIGAGIGGIVASIFEFIFNNFFHTQGALTFIIINSIWASFLCLKIPAWVEITTGEIPTNLIDLTTANLNSPNRVGYNKKPIGYLVLSALTGATGLRFITGFLTLYVAFVSKATIGIHTWEMLATISLIGGAGVSGNFVGNLIVTKLSFKKPNLLILYCLISTIFLLIIAVVINKLLFIALVAFLTTINSAMAKSALDAIIQNNIPEQSCASAFGRSETILQFGWVLGASTGILYPTNLKIGFGLTTCFTFIFLAIALKFLLLNSKTKIS